MHILIIGQNKDDIGPNGSSSRSRSSSVERERKRARVEEQDKHRDDGEDHEGG